MQLEEHDFLGPVLLQPGHGEPGAPRRMRSGRCFLAPQDEAPLKSLFMHSHSPTLPLEVAAPSEA